MVIELLCTSGKKTTTQQIDNENGMIKLDMKKETDRQIARHSCRSECVLIFYAPHKILKCFPTLHTLPKPHKPTLHPKPCQRVQSC
jgi:hypothetical protein